MSSPETPAPSLTTTTPTPTATVIEIGEAVTARIRTIDGASCAVFDLVPDFKFSEIRQLQIVVAPQTYTRGNKDSASRDRTDETVKLNVAVMQKLGSKTAIPEMLLLTEAIAKGLERRVISRGLVLSVEFDPLYDAEQFAQTRVFIAVCTVTIKVVK